MLTAERETEQVKETVPTWLVPAFTFIAGIAFTYAAVKPTDDTLKRTDHAAEIQKLEDECNARVRSALFEGIKSGYLSAKQGEPMPVDTLQR